MVLNENDIVIERNLDRLGSSEMNGYVVHVVCVEGALEFSLNDRRFALRKGEAMIITVNSRIEDARSSVDLKVHCIYISASFLEVATPKSNYGIIGTLLLFDNPIMKPDERTFHRLRQDFDDIESRLHEPHDFLDDIMMCYVQAMFLDFFHIHSKENQLRNFSEQNASVMGRFITMLEQGEYVKHRDITYYADKLFVTSKHLSELCKQISGFSANYWILRFTTIHIRRLLKQRDMTFTEIADMFDFSSPAYFNRFVQRNLGAPPSAFRK